MSLLKVEICWDYFQLSTTGEGGFVMHPDALTGTIRKDNVIEQSCEGTKSANHKQAINKK